MHSIKETFSKYFHLKMFLREEGMSRLARTILVVRFYAEMSKFYDEVSHNLEELLLINR